MSLPIRGIAASGRSHCKLCLEVIECGSQRIGCEAFLAGRIATAWMHPTCFVEGLSVEHADANRGKCRVTDVGFKKGDPRCIVPTGPGKFYASIGAAGKMLTELLQEEPTFSLSAVNGLGDLTDSERELFLGAAPGARASKKKKTVSGAASPTVVPAAEEPRAAPAQPRRKSSRTVGGAAAADAAAADAASNDKVEPSSKPAAHAKPTPAVSGSPGAGAAGDAAAQPGSAAAVLTDYELRREEQIRRNRERLMALDITSLAAEMAASAPAPAARPRGISARRKDSAEPLPPRKSLRSQGIAPDGSLAAGIDHERRNGTVVLMDKAAALSWLSGQGAEKPPAGKPPCPLAFASANGRPESDAAFLEMLRSCEPVMRTPEREAEEVTAGTRKGRKSQAADGSAAAPKVKGKGKAQEVPAAAAAAAAPRAVGGAASLCKLRLAENCVAKVVPRGAVHLDFNPRADTLIVATGDKDGHIGLWRVDGGCSTSAPAGAAALAAATVGGGSGAAGKELGAEEAEEEEEEEDAGTGAEDGVFLFRPHSQYICGLKWAPDGSPKLLSASYDGSVRCLDVSAGQWTELYTDPDDDELSAFDCDAAAAVAFVGGKGGEMRSVDLRAGKASMPAVTTHGGKRINCIHMDPVGQSLVATASGDSYVCVWDVRKFGKGAKPLNSLVHGKTCQSAYFAPANSGGGGPRVLSTSYDNTLRIWSGVGAGGAECAAITIKHDNHTGRWVSPFRAVWAPAGDAVVCGSLKRATEVISAETGKVVASFASALMTAIPPRHACHPTVPAIVAATGSGRLHVWRG